MEFHLQQDIKLDTIVYHVHCNHECICICNKMSGFNQYKECYFQVIKRTLWSAISQIVHASEKNKYYTSEPDRKLVYLYNFITFI